MDGHLLIKEELSWELEEVFLICILEMIYKDFY